MEYVEGASSLSKETVAMATSQEVGLDDLLSLNVQNGVSSDDFFVDDLLNFSNEDAFVDQDEPEEEEEHKGFAFVSLSQLHNQTEPKLETSNPSTSLSPKDEFGPAPSTELTVPVLSLLIFFAQNFFLRKRKYKTGGSFKVLWLWFFVFGFTKGVIFNRRTSWRTLNGYPIL